MLKKLFLLTILTLPLYAEMSFDTQYREYLFVQSFTEKDYETTSLNYHSYSTDLLGVDLGWGDRQTSYQLLDTKWGTLNYSPVETYLSYNSDKAFGGNDGALWQGKGFNNITSFGLDWQHEYFSVRFNPEYWVAQNSDFNILETSISDGYGDYWDGYGYDLLQRYGDSAYGEFSWGDTDIRFHYHDYFTIGFSTENIILGPGRTTNILLGDNAEGFPHVDLGTYRPVDIPHFGKAEMKIFYGSFHESDFYDDDSDNDYAWFSGVSIAIAPNILKNFTFGFNHIYYAPLSEWEGVDLIKALMLRDSNNYTDTEGDEDRMLSFTFDWKVPSAGLTVYGEYAKNDDASDWIFSPEHSTGFVLGAAQILPIQKLPGKLIFSFEYADLTKISKVTTTSSLGGSWYRHGWAGYTQGYANNGQCMGASIGTGSSTQWFNLAYYDEWGMAGISFQRIRYDQDYFNEVVYPEGNSSNNGKYVDLIPGLETTVYIGDVNIFSRLDIIKTFNYIWDEDNDFWNAHFELGASYRF